MAREHDSITSTILWFSIRLLVNVILIFILVEGFIGGYQWSYKLFADCPYVATSGEEISFTVQEGDTATQIAQELEAAGVVENRYLFLARAYLGKYNTRIQTGTYTVGPGMSPNQICRVLCGIQSEGTS
jgi:cell division protein YceG involved in septum cleavage